VIWFAYLSDIGIRYLAILGILILTNDISGRSRCIAMQRHNNYFGRRSRNGKPAIMGLLTVTLTCNIQNRNILELFTENIGLYRPGLLAFSVLPR
jgi:hypothetical protein